MNSIPLWKLLRNSTGSDIPCALLLAVETEGSGPGRSGAAMAVTSEGKTRGTVGGGTMEHELVTRALEMLESSLLNPELVSHSHVDDSIKMKKAGKGEPSGMICSGSQITAILPFRKSMIETADDIIERLEAGITAVLHLSSSGLSISESSSEDIHRFSLHDDDNWEYTGPLGLRDTVHIVGGGHVGRSLARLLEGLSFQTVIIDQRDRDSFENPPNCRWIVAPFEEAYKHIPDGARNWAIIMTPFHSSDAEVLKKLAGKALKYVGMMASSSKRKKIFSDLQREGISEEYLRSVHCPIGISIGSRTPEEIAVSIAAELIKIRNG